MFDLLKTAIASALEAAAGIEDLADEREAAKLVDMFAELERISTAGRTLAARRVEKSRLWMQQGHRTPAHWTASHAQTTVAAAIGSLETARKLEELPATREAFKTGALSHLQASEIARGASADPSAERPLLKSAFSESVAGLRERCRSVVAAAEQDADADERLHRSRYLRHWSDPTVRCAWMLASRRTPAHV